MKYKYNFKDYKFKLLGQNLLLHPFKSLFWKEQSILFISDLHIGKAAHFRKAGVPVSEKVHMDDYEKLDYLVDHYKPKRLIFLGDLFHSEYNKTWNEFEQFATNKISLRPELVMGNHDILDREQYSFMDICSDTLVLEPFILSHEPLSQGSFADHYNLCGHLHPSIRISGPARQSFRIECFYFGKRQAILPAFGNFTGTSRLPKRAKNDFIFGITENSVIPLHQKS